MSTDLRPQLSRLIAAWKGDERGLRTMAKTSARSGEYSEAASFVTTADTMRTVIREAEALLQNEA